MKKKRLRLLLLTLNLITLFVFIKSFNDYVEREKIINLKTPIENYEIINYRCHMKGGSIVDIKYKLKKYRVGLAYNYCYALEKNQIQIDFFYSKNKDEIFTSSGLTKKMIITFGVLFIFFALFWFIPKKYW